MFHIKKFLQAHQLNSQELHIPRKEAIFIFLKPIPANYRKLCYSESSLFHSAWSHQQVTGYLSAFVCSLWILLQLGTRIPSTWSRINSLFQGLFHHSHRELVLPGGLRLTAAMMDNSRKLSRSQRNLMSIKYCAPGESKL
jgi:hypothetical protein